RQRLNASPQEVTELIAQISVWGIREQPGPRLPDAGDTFDNSAYQDIANIVFRHMRFMNVRHGSG
ncbi:hypothetical protein, partial [Elizabethkingia meningoseptica]|uniref:hypothetical protein n=1 Tax=Elizabethkingia meningoseptica TaxID=238 RepID=UPI00319AD095